MLLMKQTARTISTYSADVFGAASALFELGGMTVIHDASGCNSTYTTHDEPRWFDMESMVYISAVTEMEAILGDDEKLFGDIAAAAAELKPKFIAIAGTPVPTMTGFDFAGAAKIIERRTGIPTFGFPTTGMRDYSLGISMALEALAERFVTKTSKTDGPSCNILGLTPLDFSLNGMDKSIAAFLENRGFRVLSTWAMGCDLDAIGRAASAHVNVVVSAAGLKAAQLLKHKFGTPYVVGLPIGQAEGDRLIENIARVLHAAPPLPPQYSGDDPQIAIISEAVRAQSLAACIYAETGNPVKCICPPEISAPVLLPQDSGAYYEGDIRQAVAGKKVLIADPLYASLTPKGCRFLSLPHEAFSGRMFSSSFPDLIKDNCAIVKEASL